MDLTPDWSAARAHLRFLTGEDDSSVCWQVFHDAKPPVQALARSWPSARMGDISGALLAKQAQGCGVFVAVNVIDGGKRRLENVQGYRAIFLDFDGAELPDEWPIAPGLLVQSSNPGGRLAKFQAWWKVQPGDDIAAWQAVTKELIARYDADKNCALPTQVGRLAGFWHLKDVSAPHMVRIISESADAVAPTLDAFASYFDICIAEAKERHERALKAVRRDDMTEPPGGWDHDADVKSIVRIMAQAAKWKWTSDGYVSAHKMALRCHDFGISPATAEALILEYLPCGFAPHWADNHIAEKVAHAYRYAKGEFGQHSASAPMSAADMARFMEEYGE